MSRPNQFSLLAQKRFAPFFWTQFFGAGNDNIFKFAFTVLATYHAAEWGNLDPKSAGAIIGGVFILPFVFFSATSGQLADKLEKSSLIRFVKNFEIAVMAIIALGFFNKNIYLLFTGVFLMGLHSTLFGPVKYAYLPQHLREHELTGGNGMVEMGTFVAILLGTMLGGALVAIPETGAHYVAAVSVFVAIIGRVSAGLVPHSPASDPALKINWNPFSETWRNLHIAKQNRTVFLSLLGISWLWFFGSIFLTSFTGFAKTVLGGSESVVTLLLALFSIGIGIGSLLCEKLSGSKVEIGLVPFGSIGMTVFAVDLYFASRNLQPVAVIGAAEFIMQWPHLRVMADLFLLAMFGGFFSVPLYALIQQRCEPAYRARVIAANNILGAIFMVAASIMAAALAMAGFTLPQIFLVTGILNALVAVYIYTLVPEFLMRFITWMLIHSVYRIEKHGLEHIPAEGAAVLVCNHVSFVDALIIGGVVQRPVRFVMDHNIFNLPVLNFVFKTGKAIPIASRRENPAMLEKSFVEIDKALRDGDLVCIFPEGRITDNGEIYPFKPGISRILASTPVPVVPLALRGLWGSFFSRKDGAAMTRPLRRGLFSKIILIGASPVAAADATPEHLQDVVLNLRGEHR
ncbi:MAG: MFS transporter [Burkholderiales bacterium]